MTAKSVLTSLLLASSFLLLASCPGNGGASYSGGATYGGSGGSSSSSASASDILSQSNGDEFEAIVQLISSNGGSGGSGGSSSGNVFDDSNTSRLSFSASDIGLPSGGSVTLTIIAGDEERTLTGSASDDGNVYFDMPAVASDTQLTVSMVIRDSTGTLVLKGSSGKTISGESDSLAITLSDKIDVPVSCSFSADFFMYAVKDAAGTVSYYYPGSTSFPAKLGSTVQYMGLKMDEGGSVYTTGDWQPFTVSEGAGLEMELEAGGSFAEYIGTYVNFIYYENWNTYELTFDSTPSFMTLLIAADSDDQLSFAYVNCYIDHGDGTETLITPSTYVGPGTQVKAKFKIKMGGVRGEENETDTVYAETHA